MMRRLPRADPRAARRARPRLRRDADAGARRRRDGRRHHRPLHLRGPPRVSQAADFLVYAIGDEALGRVAGAGYLVPANLEVADLDRRSCSRSSGRPTPVSSTPASRDMVLPPLIDDYAALEAAVATSLRQLLRARCSTSTR